MTEIDPELSRLYREASAADPPAALDAAILAAARKQVSKPQREERSQRQERSQRHERSFWSRWMVPASAIATLVLGVSIALLLEREQPGTNDDTITRQIPQRPQSPPPARVTEPSKAKAAASAAPAVAANKGAPAGVPAQAPAPRSAEAAPSAAQAFPAESRAKASESKTMRESNVASDSALGGAGAAAPAAPAAAGKLAPMRPQAIQRPAEAWLDEISRLKREGRDKEAAEQLAEFRKAYPSYAVPETLLLK